MAKKQTKTQSREIDLNDIENMDDADIELLNKFYNQIINYTPDEVGDHFKSFKKNDLIDIIKVLSFFVKIITIYNNKTEVCEDIIISTPSYDIN